MRATKDKKLGGITYHYTRKKDETDEQALDRELNASRVAYNNAVKHTEQNYWKFCQAKKELFSGMERASHLLGFITLKDDAVQNIVGDPFEFMKIPTTLKDFIDDHPHGYTQLFCKKYGSEYSIKKVNISVSADYKKVDSQWVPVPQLRYTCKYIDITETCKYKEFDTSRSYEFSDGGYEMMMQALRSDLSVILKRS